MTEPRVEVQFPQDFPRLNRGVAPTDRLLLVDSAGKGWQVEWEQLLRAIPPATATSAGLISAEDKAWLDAQRGV